MAILLDLANLSDAAYGGSLPADGNWRLLEKSTDSSDPSFVASAASDGYFGAAYINKVTGEIVITNEGTDPWSVKNLLADLKISAVVPPKALDDAATFAIEN